MESDNKKEEALGKFDNLNFDSIECSDVVLRRLLWKDYKGRSIAVIIGSIALLIFIISIGFFYGIALPMTTIMIYLGYLRNKAQALFMKEFSERNGLFYEPSLPINDVTGNLFKHGHSQTITHALTGSYHGQKARFFYYTYSIGHGRHKTIYYFTIIEIFFEKTEFPYILLRAKSGNWMTAGKHDKISGGEKKIRLEKEFEKNFDLFARDGYGVEVMQIFSKDFLLFLKEKNSNFSIELQGNRMYIYDDIWIEQKQQLQEFFEVIGASFGKIAPLLNRLDDDFAALHKHYKK